jgi:hypothetical protein
MRVQALVLRASPKEIVSARWSGLRSENMAEIASIASGTVAASENGRTDRELMRIVNTRALSASRTRT